MVVGATVVVVSLAAISVVPPEQAETNNARIRNQPVSRFMIRVCHGDPSPLEATQPPKTRKGSAKGAAFPKLRTRARENCEHALVELGGIEPPSVEE